MGTLRALKKTSQGGAVPKSTAPILPSNLQDPTAFTVNFTCCGKTRQYRSNHVINKTHFLDCETCGTRYEYQSHYGYPHDVPGGVWIFYYKGAYQYLFRREETPPKKTIMQKISDWLGK